MILLYIYSTACEISFFHKKVSLLKISWWYLHWCWSCKEKSVFVVKCYTLYLSLNKNIKIRVFYVNNVQTKYVKFRNAAYFIFKNNELKNKIKVFFKIMINYMHMRIFSFLSQIIFKNSKIILNVNRKNNSIIFSLKLIF